MERDLFQILQERGFVEWCSDPDELSRVFRTRLTSGYIGFGPTADSLRWTSSSNNGFSMAATCWTSTHSRGGWRHGLDRRPFWKDQRKTAFDLRAS